MNGVDCLAMSDENELIYCLVHMYKHYKGSGFGLRQIIDFFILSKNNPEILKSESFFRKINSLRIENFTCGIIEVSKKYLNLDYSESNLNQEILDLFVEDIIMAGVFGAKTKERLVNVLIADKRLKENSSNTKSKLRVLFPKRSELPIRYDYSKKNVLLVPVAWLHRIIRNINRGSISLKRKSTDNKFIEKRMTLNSWISEQ